MLKDRRLEWWREARFGMFIHWGLYSIPAGVWKGKDVPGIGEWIMYRGRIPVSEYRELAKSFNPVKFNAEKWVGVAKSAGMKYIVITAKHHDGFAMYDSLSSTYDIVDATPYGHDPMKDLARACRKAGIKLGFYYSQFQDWHHPDGACNEWDYPDKTRKDFGRYWQAKVKPQVRELLTQYGPVALMWFDTPGTMTEEQSLELKCLVHQLQPNCLVSGRVGNNVGDYASLDDNEIPAGRMTGAWEAPCTINDTWGFKKKDHHWKSARTLLYRLTDLAGKGVNYLLNVGPTAEGVIPEPSVKRLREVGRWMKVNGEAIYGAEASPYPHEFSWGRITQKPGALYLLIYRWRRTIVLPGLRNRVVRVHLLKDKKRKVKFEQGFNRTSAVPELRIFLPERKPGGYVPVVAMDISGRASVDADCCHPGTGKDKS